MHRAYIQSDDDKVLYLIPFLQCFFPPFLSYFLSCFSLTIKLLFSGKENRELISIWCETQFIRICTSTTLEIGAYILYMEYEYWIYGIWNMMSVSKQRCHYLMVLFNVILLFAFAIVPSSNHLNMNNIYTWWTHPK